MRKAFILPAAVSTMAVLAGSGCAFLPLPSTRTPIASRKTSDFAFAESDRPSRSEIVSKLGEPNAFYPDIRVACYRVTSVRRRSIVFLFVIPARFNRWTEEDIAYIEFDETDHVQRAVVCEGKISKRYAKLVLAEQEQISKKKATTPPNP